MDTTHLIDDQFSVLIIIIQLDLVGWRSTPNASSHRRKQKNDRTTPSRSTEKTLGMNFNKFQKWSAGPNLRNNHRIVPTRSSTPAGRQRTRSICSPICTPRSSHRTQCTATPKTPRNRQGGIWSTIHSHSSLSQKTKGKTSPKIMISSPRYSRASQATPKPCPLPLRILISPNNNNLKLPYK